MRVSSDNIEYHIEVPLIDQLSTQLKFILPPQAPNLPPSNITLPWVAILVKIDFLRSLNPEEREILLHTYWSSPLCAHILFKSIICNFGLHGSNQDIWKKRLQESIIELMAQQSQEFQLQDHWSQALF